MSEGKITQHQVQFDVLDSQGTRLGRADNMLALEWAKAEALSDEFELGYVLAVESSVRYYSTDPVFTSPVTKSEIARARTVRVKAVFP